MKSSCTCILAVRKSIGEFYYHELTCKNKKMLKKARKESGFAPFVKVLDTFYFIVGSEIPITTTKHRVRYK